MDVPEALVRAAQHGDNGAVDRLLESIWPDLFRIAYGITRNRVIAQEAAQESCVSVLRSLASLTEPTSFRPWVIRIITRAARSAVRRESRDVGIGLTSVAARPLVDAEQRLDVSDAVARLPLAQREVVVLHFYADMKSGEIARALRIPDGTVRFRLLLAKRRLRALLDADAPASPHLCQEARHDTL